MEKMPQPAGRKELALRSFAPLYAAMDAKLQSEQTDFERKHKLRNAIETAFLAKSSSSSLGDPSSNMGNNAGFIPASQGFKRINLCTTALCALDRRGWERSYHQRYFHNQFIRACARVFWKTEQEGQFAKDHQKILELNG